ncbi:dipeptidase [Gracilimonas mengyeensis]|uniref:Membrane dipeptidase/D-alanyl-D-alanine dipeptidase n=1 Tax=Gracilimonas mengyeensis TaxID=1302730 RepID=A0A521EM49_9BACT|nr:dipeptidase [Gracilimonas mengyeensis]SMO85003.1 membrane dipeptidase/D-alanyl-D-alanine dipeptidase [Gracilimonas mengyeensis]
MKHLLPILAFFAILMSACTTEEQETFNKAMEIHDRVITLDTHVDINVNNFTSETNYTQRLDTQVDLPKMKEGGLDVVWLVVYTGQDTLSEEGYAAAYDNAISKFEAIHRLTDEIAPDQIELATTSEEVREIVAEGKKVAMIGVENAYPIGEDLSRVEEFYNRGARYMSLSHNGHSQFSDSNTGERDDEWMHNGLSEAGRQVIAEMNRLGMMIDISHPSKEANIETMKLSKAPVIASHSSARALNDVSRNLSDEELQLLKENGGVVQTVAFRSYIDSEKHAAWQEASRTILEEEASKLGMELLSWREIRELSEEEREEYMDMYKTVQDNAAPRIEEEVNIDTPPVNVADFVDHVDYMVDLIGIEHVGISSDFDGGGGVYNWMDASETFNVTHELVKRGYTEEEIAMLWSGNLLRILDEVEAVAEEIQQGEIE